MGLILIIQFVVGVIQLFVALVALIYQWTEFQFIKRTLWKYWIMVVVYFIVLMTLHYFSRDYEIMSRLSFIWFMCAWIIAALWFKNVKKWFKKI